MLEKTRFLYLIYLAILPFGACFGQDKEIEVHLSRVDSYLKMELTNHTAEDLYIPHLFRCFSLWDENGVDVTNAYESHLLFASPDFYRTHPFFGPPSEEFTDGNYDVQQRIYREAALEKEKEIFLKINPSITEKKISKRYKFDFDSFLEFLYAIRKYDGVAIKTEQTLNIFMPIGGLIEHDRVLSGEKLTIRFTRRNDWDYSLFDTVKFEGYRIYTPLPELNAGYRLYDGAIDCDDVIILN